METCSNASGHVLEPFAERCESENSISERISIDFPSFEGLRPDEYLLKLATTVCVTMDSRKSVDLTRKYAF